MFTLREQPARFYASARLLRKILRELLANVPALASGRVLTGNQCLYPGGEQRTRLFWLRDGFLRCKRDQRLLFFLEPGDLVAFGFLPETTHIYADSPVTVDEYLEKDLLHAVRHEPLLFDLWIRCLSLELELITTLVGGEDEAAPEAPESMLASIDPVGPRADVLIDDTPVGSVLTRELFRLLSGPLEETPADPVGQVLVSVPRRQLLELFQRYPRQALRLLENLGQGLASSAHS